MILCLELEYVKTVYLRKYINFTTCVYYKNSVCELLILKLYSPSLIIILMYKLGTWKSALSVLPFSALVNVCMYNGCQTTYFRKLCFSLDNIFYFP